jgi:hypothetical protein
MERLVHRVQVRAELCLWERRPACCRCMLDAAARTQRRRRLAPAAAGGAVRRGAVHGLLSPLAPPRCRPWRRVHMASTASCNVSHACAATQIAVCVCVALCAEAARSEARQGKPAAVLLLLISVLRSRRCGCGARRMSHVALPLRARRARYASTLRRSERDEGAALLLPAPSPASAVRAGRVHIHWPPPAGPLPLHLSPAPCLPCPHLLARFFSLARRSFCSITHLHTYTSTDHSPRRRHAARRTPACAAARRVARLAAAAGRGAR